MVNSQLAQFAVLFLNKCWGLPIYINKKKILLYAPFICFWKSNSKSHVEWWSALSSSLAGKSASQSSNVSCSLPLHDLPPGFLKGQSIPIGFSPTVSAQWLSTVNLLQKAHFATNIFPCSSAKCIRFSPDFRWRPSIFWLMTNFAWPETQCHDRLA